MSVLLLDTGLVLAFLCGQAMGQENVTEASGGSSDAFHLNEVVVTGTKTEHKVSDAPVKTDLVTQEDIQEQSVQTVSDALRSIPGLFVNSEDIPGETSWRAKIRGLDFNDGYGLILVNGQRVKGEAMGEYAYGVNQIPVALIDRIEVVKGPSSVLYGSDALAGVINIITKPTPDKTIYGMEVAGGSRNTLMSNIYSGTKVGPFGAYLNASYEQSDSGAYGINNTRDDSFESKRIDTRMSYDVNDNIVANLLLELEDKDRESVYLTQDTNRYQWYTKTRIAPDVSIKLDNTSSAKISGYIYDWDMSGAETGSKSSGYTGTIGNMYYREAEARYTKTFLDRYDMTIGGEFLQEELDYNMAAETIETISAYGQLEASLTDNLTTVLGVRGDDHSRYGSHVSPKLSMMYEPLVGTTLRGSVGTGFKSPTIRQLYYSELYQHSNYWYKSNPDLEAEESLGYSFDVEQQIGSRLLVDFGLFRNDIDNKILLIDTEVLKEELPVYTYANTDKAYTQGIEVQLKAELFDSLMATLGYTYTDTETDAGKALTYVPTNMISCGLVYTYSPWGTTFSTNVQLADEMYTDASNTKETDPYSLVDVKIAKKFADHYTVSLEGNNIFDSDHGQPTGTWLGATYLVRFKMDF